MEDYLVKAAIMNVMLKNRSSFCSTFSAGKILFILPVFLFVAASCASAQMSAGKPGVSRMFTPVNQMRPAAPVCGDGIIDPGEVCDGGTNACTAAGGYPGTQSCYASCDGWGSCVSSLYCGDGAINGGFEVCDDGNNAVGDGCNASCNIEICGDGVRTTVANAYHPLEECDDGNSVGGDGCDSGCVVEFCGDRVANNIIEECDDGANASLSDGCDASCRYVYPGHIFSQTAEVLQQYIGGNPVHVSMPRSSLGPSEIGVVINLLDPESVDLGQYYAAAHGIPDENLIYVNFSPASPGDEHIAVLDFLAMKADIEAQTPGHVQAYVIAWGKPWIVGAAANACASISVALSQPITVDLADSSRCTGLVTASPFYNPSDFTFFLPKDTLNVRPSMLLWAGTLVDTKAMIDRSVLAKSTFPMGDAYFHTTMDQARSELRKTKFSDITTDMNAAGFNATHIDQSAFWGQPADENGAPNCSESINMQGKGNVFFYSTGCKNPHLSGNYDTIGFRPGALGDNMTPFGGRLDEDPVTGDTTLNYWLKRGLNATYGTVYDPGNSVASYPDVGNLALKYFFGGTALEAYLYSVSDASKGQFQGDPLTRPFGTKVTDDSGDLLIDTTTLLPGVEYIVSHADNLTGPYTELDRFILADVQVKQIRIANPKKFVTVEDNNKPPVLEGFLTNFTLEPLGGYEVIDIHAHDLELDDFTLTVQIVSGGDFSDFGMTLQSINTGDESKHYRLTVDWTSLLLPPADVIRINVTATDVRGKRNTQEIQINVVRPPRDDWPNNGARVPAGTDYINIVPGHGLSRVNVKVGTYAPGSADIFDSDIGLAQRRIDLGALPLGQRIYVRLTSNSGMPGSTAQYIYDYNFDVDTTVAGNHLPQADSQSVTVPFNGTKAITLTGSDPDGDPITFSLVQLPAHGIISGAVPNIIYVPFLGYSGPDQFVFKTNDGLADSDLPGGVVDLMVEDSPVNLSAPAAGSTLSTQVVNFTWNHLAGVSEYFLGVGTTQGSVRNAPYGDISAGSTGLLTARDVAIPLNGQPVYVRLWWKVNSSWYFREYIFNTIVQSVIDPAITSHAAGELLTTGTVTFTWDGGSVSASEYFVGVGNSAAAISTPPWGDIMTRNVGTATTLTVPIVLDGKDLHLRLWWKVGSKWFSRDYTFGRQDLSASVIEPSLTSHADNDLISNARVTFTWNGGNVGPKEYFVGLGSTSTAISTSPWGDILTQTMGLNTSLTVNDLALNGADLHLRLWWKTDTAWKWKDYRFQRANVPDVLPDMTSHVAGELITTQTVTFAWNEGNIGATEYFIGVGNSSAAVSNAPWGDVYTANVGSNTSVTVPGIVLNGGDLYFRLWWKRKGVWDSRQYIYTRLNLSVVNPYISSHAPGSLLPGSTVTFAWDAGNVGATEYFIGVGSTAASIATTPWGNIFTKNTGSVKTVTVAGIPQDGNDLYVRLWWKNPSGTWSHADTSYRRQNVPRVEPAITSHADGGRVGITATFTWDHGSVGATEFFLGVGSTARSISVAPYGNIFAQNMGMGSSANISGIPPFGQPVYVRLWWKESTGWKYKDYTFHAG